MPDTNQPSLFVPHQNNGLFSDYYLNEIVPNLTDWDAALFASGRKAHQALRELRQSIQPQSLDEAMLEENWVKPVLNVLGLHYSVQAKIRYQQSGHRKPDYAFVATAAEARAMTSDVYQPQEITHWIAVGDAKRWGANLDQPSQGQRSASQQIDEYLRYSERPWGILTDGRMWRLYHRDTSKHNTYYAVDLDALLDSDNGEAFLYFYAFFRLEAFTGGWLNQVLAGSEDFARKLTDKLEDEVYDALEMIAQGFLDYRRNRLTADAATLKTIYEQSLVLLYRLLFIFYAESREILPLHQNDEYTSTRSLQAIKRKVATALDFSRKLNADSSDLYGDLSDLFFAIDAGDASLDLPPYNGRLFSEHQHPFLKDKLVGDAQLAPALDKLARVDDSGKRVFVDYRDLEVRHLGSIYEKLLDYELALATEPLTIVKGQYAVAKTNDAVLKQTGQVYLRTGSNERKVTGSYYTPDYIVRFIVEKTLEPLLNDITNRHATQDSEGVWHVTNNTALVNEILALNVLDPATGSGHFVVDVTAYIAEWLRGLGIRPADIGNEDELIYWKRQVASSCIYAVDINPLAVELAKLSMWLTTLAKGKPLSFLDHHIKVGNSLVGTSISAIDDTAINVKDEEKRRKARERQRQKEATTGQIALFSDADFNEGVRFAVEQMNAIESTIADDVRDVKQQEERYAALTQRLGAWRQAADVWTARYFGLNLSAEQWKVVREFTVSGLIPPSLQGIVDEATRIAREQRFFHWELAFPEVFYDAQGQTKASGGFDAVVGNPPYVRYQNFSLALKNYLDSNYTSYSGTADLYLYFYELAINFLKSDHNWGYITSGTYMNSNSAKPFRQTIHDRAGFEWVANFGENQPFRGAEMVYPTIAVLRKGRSKDTFRNLFIEGVIPFSKLDAALANGEWVDGLNEVTGMDEWRFQSKDLTLLLNKIINERTPLGKLVDNKIYYGVLTGASDVFVIDKFQREKLIDQHYSSQEIIQPILRGQDARPWYQLNGEQYLICARHGIDLSQFPAVYEYLETFRSVLEPKPVNWNEKKDGKWLGRSEGSYKWYEWISPVAYFDSFSKPKIIWSDISKLPRFSLDFAGNFYNNTVYGIGSESLSLLSLLQSRVHWFCISQFATPLRLRGGLWQYRLFKQYIERLPIPSLTTAQESRLGTIAEQITALARLRYQHHEDFRRTLLNEFGGDEITSRVALYRWWELSDEKALSDEIKRQLGQDIPLKKRGEWRGFLHEQTQQHENLTAQIVTLETDMNALVYDAFGLDATERDLIERTTKYPYGAV